MDKKNRIIYVRQFGAAFSAKSFYLQKMVNLSKDNKKIKWADKLNQYRAKKLEEDFLEYIHKQVKEWKTENKKMENNRIVWVFWWQGNHHDNPMVKMCLNSIEKNLPSDAQLIVITKYNLEKYIKLPKHIIEKVNSGNISLTHLSDIVRVNLLAEWGGCWFDATVFVIRPYPYVFESELWTTKRQVNNLYIPKGRWTGFAMSGYSNNILFKLMKDLFEEYWSRYDVLIDFFLIDLFIEVLYRNVPEVKKLIDINPYNNEDVQKLWGSLPEEFDELKFKQLTASTDIYKLSWRIKIDVIKNNKYTIYGKLLSEGKEV